MDNEKSKYNNDKKEKNISLKEEKHIKTLNKKTKRINKNQNFDKLNEYNNRDLNDITE